jgi:hypothetical protein
VTSTTRFYLARGAAHPTPPAFAPAWAVTAAAVRHLFVTDPAAGGSLNNLNVSESVASPTNLLAGQWLTPGLIAGQVSGTFRLSLGVREGSGGVDGYVRVILRLVADDGTVRATLADVEHATETDSVTSYPTRILGGALTPAIAQAGDRIAVEIGHHHYSIDTTPRALNLMLGSVSLSGTPAEDAPYVNGVATTTVAAPVPLRGWVELSLDDPPAPPTALTITSTGQTEIAVSWAAPVTGSTPAGYDVRVDGGAPVAVGDVLAHTFTGLSVGTTYALEVRSTNTIGASAWVSVSGTTTNPQPSAPGIASQAILSAAGLDPSPTGTDGPAQQWWDIDGADVATYSAVRSEALVSYAIGYASREPLGKPQPLSVGVVLLVPVGDAVAIGDRFQLRLADALAEALDLDPDAATRATCIVTDVSSDPTRTWTLPGHGTGTLWNVTATGFLSRYGAGRIDGTAWPVEPVGTRVARILDSLGLTGDVDTTGPDVLPPTAIGSHHQALAPATDSTLGRLVEQRDGTVDYADDQDRRGRVPAITLDAAEIVGENFSWRQSVTDVVNSAEVSYGDETGDKVLVTDPASADPRTGVGPYPASVSTVLVDELDAYSLGADLVGRRAWPYYQLPAVTVDLARSGLDLDRLAVAYAILNGDRIALTSMPAGSPWETLPRGCFIEGYTETATAYAWRLTLVVSDPALSGVSLRYLDVTAGIAYDDVAPGLSYLDVARIEDPTDLL